MRLQVNSNITGYPFEFICCLCGVQVTSTRGYCADLDGEPFKAYYCLPCSNQLVIQRDRKKGADHVSVSTLSQE